MTAKKREIQYLVLSAGSDPFLLARVRWPDVYQAISPVRPYWQEDPGLFDLPYAPASTSLTFEQAGQLAAEWGASLPSEDEGQAPGLSLIRRLPSDWSNLSTAERRAWSIVIEAPVASRRSWRRRQSVDIASVDIASVERDLAEIALADHDLVDRELAEIELAEQDLAEIELVEQVSVEQELVEQVSVEQELVEAKPRPVVRAMAKQR